MQFERLDSIGIDLNVIPDYPQSLHCIKIRRHLYIGGIIPVTESLFGKFLPGEIPVRIHLSSWRYISMTNKISYRNIKCFFQSLQYIEQTTDLGFRKFFKPVIINFNSYTAAVKISCITPFAYSRMMPA